MQKEEIFEQEDLQVIAFKIANEEYAVPIKCVQEIIMPQSTIKIPRSPKFIEGVINLRGNIIPIIDGRKRFNLQVSETADDTRILVLELEENTIGLIVDSVSEVVYLDKKNVEPVPVEIDKDSDFILGIGKLDERLLILLNLSGLLSGNEEENIQQVMQLAKSSVAENPDQKTEKKSPCKSK